MNDTDAIFGELIIPSTISNPTAKAATPMSNLTLHRALNIIDSSNVCAMLDAWALADGLAPTKRSITHRQLLAAWLVLALEGRTPTIAAAAQVLSQRMPRRIGSLLGVPESFAALGADQIATRVRRATSRLLGLMDAYPLPTHGRRLSKQEWDTVTADRADNATRMEMKRRRFATFANTLLGAQFDQLPQNTRASASAVVVASRFRRAHATGIPAGRLATLSATDAVSAEPDAGFHVRPAPNGATLHPQYGWEDELVILSPTDTAAAPRIAVGFNPHLPGAAPARHASEALQHLADRAMSLDHVVAGRAYMAARPDHLRVVLRDLGAKVIGDYPRTALGVQDTVGNAILVEGTWYDAAMPFHLQNAFRDANSTSLDGANAGAGDAVTGVLVNERAAFTLRPSTVAGECPCTQRLEQAFPYRSQEWTQAYSAGRNTVEVYVAQLNRGEAQVDRARLRGFTGQAFMALLDIMGTNARVIAEFTACTLTDRSERRPRPGLPLMCPASASTPARPTCNH